MYNGRMKTSRLIRIIFKVLNKIFRMTLILTISYNKNTIIMAIKFK
jgi:hypothetical protein